MSFRNPLTGGGALLQRAIMSPNYLKNVSGWTVNQDGSAEFNNISIRGGTQTQGAVLMYNGTPALGNLIVSIAPGAGTDSFGNTYVQGFATYGDALGNQVTTQLNGGQLSVKATVGAYQMTLDNSGMGMSDGTFVTRYNVDQIKFLLAGDSPTMNDPGGMRIQRGDASGIQRVLTVTTGDNLTGHDPAMLWLLGADASGSVPEIRFNNSGAGAINFTNGGIDQGRGFVAQATVSANVTFAATETALITTPSITWVKGRAYRVSVWGLVSAPADSYALLRLRKTNVAGAVYKDQMRVNNLQASTSNAALSLETILTNTTAADITAPLCLTGVQGAVAQTWTFAASAGNVGYLLVEDVGSTANYVGQPIS